MFRSFRLITVILAATALATGSGGVLAQDKGKDKDKDRQEQRDKGPKEDRGGGQDKPKRAKHHDGKSLVGDKVKKDGRHKIHDHGKHSASIDVKQGKVAGVKVRHAEKGDVPVKKYKTNKKMAEAPLASGIVPVVYPAQTYGTQYLGQTWIGYAYIDDWGEEVIYWFPYDMIYDGDTGAIEYIPAY